MNQSDLDEILEQIDDLIDTLSNYENEMYIAIEVAHHLRDEVSQAEPEPDDEEDE